VAVPDGVAGLTRTLLRYGNAFSRKSLPRTRSGMGTDFP